MLGSRYAACRVLPKISKTLTCKHNFCFVTFDVCITTLQNNYYSILNKYIIIKINVIYYIKLSQIDLRMLYPYFFNCVVRI